MREGKNSEKSENPARSGVLDLVWGQGHLRSFMERLAMSTQSVVTLRGKMFIGLHT